jgi:hypothetical protein
MEPSRFCLQLAIVGTPRGAEETTLGFTVGCDGPAFSSGADVLEPKRDVSENVDLG